MRVEDESRARPASLPWLAPAAGLLAEENVLPQLERWRSEGRRTALVTVVGVEGGAPRLPGAQMAVTEDGLHVGYLSGGCLEQALALEAQDVIREGRNRLVRYGKDSPYFDIKLPCGSGLDLYIDQSLGAEQIRAMTAHRARRVPFALRTDLTSGESTIAPCPAAAPFPQSTRSGATFERTYAPDLQVLLAGSGPGLAAVAALAAAVGIEEHVVTSDEATRRSLEGTGFDQVLDDSRMQAAIGRLDFASAAVVVSHDHEKDPAILALLLATDCFYIGALGNHAVHRDRLETLRARGFRERELERIRAPVGSIPGAKSKATLAAGVLAELLAEAKALNLVP